MTLARTQSGAVLVVSLIILMILTILGMSSIQTTTLEERMAGNTLSTNTAFQAAEGSLRQGEADVLAYVTKPVPTSNGSNDLWILYAPDPDTATTDPWWHEADAAWWVSNGLTFDDPDDALRFANNAEVPIAPVHLIEEQDFVKDTLTQGQSQDETGRQYYQITSRGVDITNTAEAILRSTYARRF